MVNDKKIEEEKTPKASEDDEVNENEIEHLEKDDLNLKDIDSDRVIVSEISREMKKAYIDYAMSVIVSRALPSVEDGLKPVHRRILFAMVILVLWMEILLQL